ncbi:MAG: ATP-dependent Clp protease adaptor ClpS [bacterium]|jgi:ATP-dependent Clp protease adaptor protein ClpS
MPVLDTPVAPTRPYGPLDIPGFDEVDDLKGRSEVTGPWIVILYNCECHTFDDVEMILQKATGCSLEKAQQIAIEVDTSGRAICYSGAQEECERVASIIASIRLQVETDRA